MQKQLSLNNEHFITYHQHFVANEDFSISMRKSAFGNARYINAIGTIFEWWWAFSTSNAET